MNSLHAIRAHPVPLEIELPLPPSTNQYWRKWHNRIVISPEGRQYRGRVFQRVLPSLERTPGGRWIPRFAEGDVAVEIAWYRKAKRGDVDNIQKCVLDALQKLVYTNDKQVAHLTTFRHDQPFDGEPRLEVQIRAYGETV